MKIKSLNPNEYVTGSVSTPCGWAALAVSASGVAACIWPLVEVSRDNETAGYCTHQYELKQAAEALLAYFSGEFGLLKKVSLDGRKLSRWQRMVYNAVRSIPPGEVRSYRWVAEECGKRGASRAVGQALAANPFPLFVPCHRVIHSDGRPGNFTCGGSISGSRLKVLLQEWEKGGMGALKEMDRLLRDNRG